MKIDDTDPETIKQFKTFVLDTDKIVVPPNTDLLLFANKYNIKPVAEYCKKFIANQIDKDNIFHVIKVAYHIDADDLLQKAVEFLANNRQTLQNNPEWETFQEYHPKCASKMINLLMFSK